MQQPDWITRSQYSFTPYNPMTSEQNWIVVTEDKGTRFAVAREKSRSTLAWLPYGLTPDCKALATMIAATPDMVKALKEIAESQSLNQARALAAQALDKATFKQEQTA